jgi:hypothetical protein
MRVFAFARRGARVGICVLALGAAGAEAQQAPPGNPPESSGQSQSNPATGTEAVKPAEPTSTQPNAPAEPGTSNLPELVVEGQDKKKKKAAKAKAAAPASTTAGAATTAEPPPPGVTLGTVAPSDTGTTTFDANNVNLRTNGNGDANTFMRNLPNVQYQNPGGSNPGASSANTIDTKPQLLSISGGRTYENNFILNGVSVTNITGPANNVANLTDTGIGPVGGSSIQGMSPQNIYVPTEFIGQATIIDSNASAEYGQFMGGVVSYDLAGPPTDRYHASVSASRDTSDFATYILATPNGTNPTNRAPPSYEKTNLSASVGAPITRDFSFIAQASRREAESSKPKSIQIGGDAPENSDNIFLRFAATVRTDIGKFTLDTSRTDYFQHWDFIQGRNVYIDANTEGATTQLKYETNLAGVRADEVGLGQVKLTSRAFYNTSETQNNSGDSALISWRKQALNNYVPGTGWNQQSIATLPDWCHAVNPSTYPAPTGTAATASINCYDGGYGNTLQGQTDYGAQATLTGDVLLGNFMLGTELKNYEGRSARMEDLKQGSGNVNGSWICQTGDPFCSPGQYIQSYFLYRKRDITATLNAVHAFAEIDQTWEWFNVRGGVRLDYDDYAKNENIAPRLVGTIRPFDGLSFTGGYNRYYIGETLYYAIRDQVPGVLLYNRGAPVAVPGGLRPGDFGAPIPAGNATKYTTQDLSTPYNDEFTGAVGIRDPLLGGQVRLKYLERYGEDQFATVACGAGCTKATNDGEKFYRSASAEYTKEWYGLSNPFNLNAAAITGNVTWSEQWGSANSYLLNSDINGNGTADTIPILYNDVSYRPEQFTALTGNLDIPVRFGATVATVWFDGALELNATAGINLGFQGVYDTGGTRPYRDANGVMRDHEYYQDWKFTPSLKLDVSGQINVTEQAAIQFNVNNITNSAQNTIAIYDNPWVLGRSYWVGSSLRF